jgi:hypothetical protein
LLVKFDRLLFHPVRSARLLHPGMRRCCINIEHESDIGDAAAGGECVQPFDNLTV